MADLPKIASVTGTGVPVPGDDIDTDRIIPARFMKCVTFDGLGDYMFYDTRFQEDGSERPHPLNDARFKGATVLIAGNNFGCGSSREHAPQAIYRAGFRAIVAEGFAEIFFGNSTQLGMPCVTVDHETRLALSALVEAAPETPLTIDLEALTISAGDQTFPCAMRDGARSSLLAGTWDPLPQLLADASEIDETARKLAYV